MSSASAAKGFDRRFSVPRPSVFVDVDSIMDDLDQHLGDLQGVFFLVVSVSLRLSGNRLVT